MLYLCFFLFAFNHLHPPVWFHSIVFVSQLFVYSLPAVCLPCLAVLMQQTPLYLPPVLPKQNHCFHESLLAALKFPWKWEEPKKGSTIWEIHDINNCLHRLGFVRNYKCIYFFPCANLTDQKRPLLWTSLHSCFKSDKHM